MTQTNGFFTTSDQAHLYYEVHGKGQPLFLVHGWQCSSRFWQHNIHSLIFGRFGFPLFVGERGILEGLCLLCACLQAKQQRENEE